MALSKEMYVEKVPLVKTSFFPFSGKETRRIGQEESLNYELIRESLLTNAIGKLPVPQGEWYAIAVLSPYSEDFHVMMVDLSPKYKPDPTHVKDEEGTNLMRFWAETVAFQKRLPETQSVNVGWNWSPRHLNLAQRGFQSIITKWHPQFWNFNDLNHLVPISSLDETTKRGIEGNKFNELFGRFVLEAMHSSRILGSEINKFISSEGKTDNRGVEFSLRKNLVETFGTSNFFEDFLKKFATYLSEMALDFTWATTTSDGSLDEALIGIEFETGKNGMKDILAENLRLLSLEERRHRLLSLEDKYSPYVLKRLLLLDNYLKEKANVPSRLWFRKGFAYALVFSEDLASNRSVMRIMPGVFQEDRGGVVEALGVALTRNNKVNELQLPVNEKRHMVLLQLGKCLQNC